MGPQIEAGTFVVLVRVASNIKTKNKCHIEYEEGYNPKRKK